jgi:hypothetical protein
MMEVTLGKSASTWEEGADSISQREVTLFEWEPEEITQRVDKNNTAFRQ